MQEYWKQFNLLCSLLENAGETDLVHELRDAQLYVNGLTDGWHEFLKAFEIVAISDRMNGEASQLAQTLIKQLEFWLKNRP